jgi:IMP dehydrogenase
MNSELLDRYFPKRTKYLDYANVAIIPDFSTVQSRTSVITGGSFKSRSWDICLSWDVPIIPANMDSIVGVQLVKNTVNAGGIASLHRFSTLEQLAEDLEQLVNVRKTRLFGSVGLLTREVEQRRASMLYANGIRNFMIDIAHGHTQDMMHSIRWLRQKFGGDILIAAGNVGTAKAVQFLYSAGADIVKVGIAGGKVCRTRNVTGVYTPMFSTVLECANLDCVKSGHVLLIADGGIREYGDVAKAIGAGAGLVMAGYLFAGCTDANMPTIYRGMASNEVAYSAYELGLRDDKPTAAAEGVQITVAQSKKKSSDVVVELQAALRSSYSYVGAKNTKEFQESVQFIEIDPNQR